MKYILDNEHASISCSIESKINIEPTYINLLTTVPHSRSITTKCHILFVFHNFHQCQCWRFPVTILVEGASTPPLFGSPPANAPVSGHR